MSALVKICSRAVRNGSLLVALAVGVAPITLLTARASAADATKSERAVARRLIVEGDAFFAQQNVAQALARYSEAYRVMHVPTVGVEVVKAQKALGRLVEAAQTAREVAALPERRGEPAVFNEARLQAAQEVVSLSGMTPSLLLDVQPGGVLFTVQIDGASPPGETPFALNPGAHHVRVSADGHQNVDRDVTLQQGERQTLSVRLFPDPAPAAPPVSSASTGGVTASGATASSSGASSDATNTGSTPRAATAPTPPPATQRAHAGSGRTLGWLGIGIAGVGLAAGTFAGINALQTKPDCPQDICSPSQRKDIRNSRKMGTIADVSFGVAIVAGAFGIWQLVTSSGADDDSESAEGAATDLFAGHSERSGVLHVTALDLGTGPFELRLSGCF